MSNTNNNRKRPRRTTFLKEFLPPTSTTTSNPDDDDGNHNDNDNAIDAYERNLHQTQLQRRIRRPYPSSCQIILKLRSANSASITGKDGFTTTKKKQDEESGKKKQSPLITSFLASIGRSMTKNDDDNNTNTNNKDTDAVDGSAVNANAKEGNEEEANNNKEKVNVKVKIEALDNPSNSTISKKQHQRYITSIASGDKWKQTEKRDLLKLKHLVQDEQQKYRKAVLDFWFAHKDRVLVGFTNNPKSAAAKFVGLAANPNHVKVAWRKEFQGRTYAANCCQVISLDTMAGISAGNKSRWTVDVIESRALSESTGTTTGQDGSNQQPIEEEVLASLPEPGTPVPFPAHNPRIQFLKDDTMAIQLAKDHNIPMIATLEAVEAIMATDPFTAQWKLPVRFQENGFHGRLVAIIDSPLPQPDTSPRDCLTRGINQGLSQWVDHDFKTTAPTDAAMAVKKDKPRYRYVQLTLPPSSGAATSGKVKQTNVLVRVPNQSTRAHAHVEYFPERGEEATSSYERSLWILDHFLKIERSLVARIDPASSSSKTSSSSCRVIKWEPTSISHALAGIDKDRFQKQSPSQSSEASVTQDPMDHWHRLAKLLPAIPTMSRKDGNFLLCLPGRGFLSKSASVHMETTGSISSNSNVGGEIVATTTSIDAEAELARAGEVQLGANALQRTIQNWKWTDDRVPFTFPIDPANTGDERGARQGNFRKSY